jgi:hypothetical protein
MHPIPDDRAIRRHDQARPELQYDLGLAETAKTPLAAARTRATRREADWRRQLTRAFLYATQQSPELAQELFAELERREREGPEFIRQRPDSAVTDAPLVTLDRNERVRLVYKFRALARRSWSNKERGKHRGIITRTCEDVFFVLMYLTEKYGRVFPSLKGLMHLARCCKQSVVTALDDLERLGFVTKIRRLRQIMTPLGFTTRQITNAYKVHEPTSGLGLLANLVFATESNSWAASADTVDFLECGRWLDPQDPLHAALIRLGTLFERERSRA